jgi:hypothetical protein
MVGAPSDKIYQRGLAAPYTQARNTTMPNCLGAAIPTCEWVITCEEVYELKLPLPDVVSCTQGKPVSRAPVRSSCDC